MSDKVYKIKCSTCGHLQPSGSGYMQSRPWCGHPLAENPASDDNAGKLPLIQRLHPSLCGPEALWWKERMKKAGNG